MLLTLLTVNDIINYYNSRSHCVFDERRQLPVFDTMSSCLDRFQKFYVLRRPSYSNVAICQVGHR